MRKSLISLIAVSAALTSCSTYHRGDGFSDISQAVAKKSNAPIVEAFVEYVGPPSKWAGPNSLMLHLVARDDQNMQVALTPNMFQRKMKTLSARDLASSKQFSAQIARTQLSDLFIAVNNDKENFQGCLYPIRLRFVRGDGSVFEKQGCRNHTGWPTLVSQSFSQWLQIAISSEDASGQKVASGN